MKRRQVWRPAPEAADLRQMLVVQTSRSAGRPSKNVAGLETRTRGMYRQKRVEHTIVPRGKTPEPRAKTLAIHVVWTVYRTWLPGGERGHWSPLLDFYGRLVRAGHQLHIADGATRETAGILAKGEPVDLRESDQRLVAQTVGEVIQGGPEVGVIRGVPASPWTVHITMSVFVGTVRRFWHAGNPWFPSEKLPAAKITPATLRRLGGQ